MLYNNIATQASKKTEKIVKTKNTFKSDVIEYNNKYVLNKITTNKRVDTIYTFFKENFLSISITYPHITCTIYRLNIMMIVNFNLFSKSAHCRIQRSITHKIFRRIP